MHTYIHQTHTCIHTIQVLVRLRANPHKRKFMCPRDGFTIIRNSELLCGVMDKVLVGGTKVGLFHILLRDFGNAVCADRMSRLAKLCARYLSFKGFSIGISDVIPGYTLRKEKNKLTEIGYDNCEKVSVSSVSAIVYVNSLLNVVSIDKYYNSLITTYSNGRQITNYKLTE